MITESTLTATPPAGLTGSVMEVIGMTASVADFPAPVGAVVEIDRPAQSPIEGEVIGFRDRQTIVYPLNSVAGVRRGCRVRLVRSRRRLRVGDALQGRVVNAHGRAIDGKPQPMLPGRASLDRDPPKPVERPRIDASLSTGVRAIDGLLTCGRGQRLGIFAGSGVGKSVLLGMMARNTEADVNVIGLVGERGREVNEFIQRDLGPEGLKRSVVVVATSSEPALMRLHAAATATALAETFRDQGKDVLLLIDSVTRMAMASREIGLAAGEPPTTKGYPPSTFSMLPKLVERAGRSATGSVTAYYSVLVEADDPNDPVADAMRGLLDGHIWLSRKLASEAHYPAIDALESISRLMNELATPEQRSAAQTVRQLLTAFRENEDLISIGAYRKGSSRIVDAAIALRDDLHRFLRQSIDEAAPQEETVSRLLQLAAKAEAQLKAPVGAAPTPITPNAA